MTDETKRIFDAPWKVDNLKFIQNAKHKYLALCDEKEVVNRLVRLPELYGALVEEATEKCNECLHDNLRMGRIPFTGKYDLVEAGCPFKDEQCHTASHLDLLKKVRAGK